jgi:hypothetical protein
MDTTPFTTSRCVYYHIDSCPSDKREHDYQLDVQSLFDISVIGFATDLKPSAPVGPWEGTITFICPNTKEPFNKEVIIHPKAREDIVSVALHVSLPSNGSASPDTSLSIDKVLEDELTNWVKSSGDTARDFSKTMITTATGAIAVYFAVLKYLGADTAATTKGLIAGLGITASIAFLVSAGLFVVGMQPHYARLSDWQGFLKNRDDRLIWMSRFIISGTVVFALGIICAIVSFILSYLRI